MPFSSSQALDVQLGSKIVKIVLYGDHVVVEGLTGDKIIGHGG